MTVKAKAKPAETIMGANYIAQLEAAKAERDKLQARIDELEGELEAATRAKCELDHVVDVEGWPEMKHGYTDALPLIVRTLCFLNRGDGDAETIFSDLRDWARVHARDEVWP